MYFYDINRNAFGPVRTKTSFRAAAKILNTTDWKLKRFIKIYWDEGEDGLKNTQWGGGRPLKKLNLDERQIDKITSKETLTTQAHLSLAARAL